jgi:predicted MPP superfamily phosphohydrolase
VKEERGASVAQADQNGRRKKRVLAIAIVALVALGVAAATDAFYIEPFRIQVTHYDLQGNVASPVKIADLSDVHTHGMGRNEERALQIIAEERPDLIVVTGDCLGNTAGDYRLCENFYQHLHAPLGVWVVRGNWENDRPVNHERAFYAKSGVHLLVNQAPCRGRILR